MALDMNIMVKVKNRPTEKQLKELQYNLMHRFGFERFFNPDDDSEKKDFVEVLELTNGGFGIDLILRGRHYARGYERGDGLKGAMMLLYLIRAFPEGDVWYGSDGLEEYGEDLFERYDEKKALELLCHFVDVGKLPFLKEMDEVLNSEDGTSSPLCSFCGVPMIRNSMSSEYASFYCAGCHESLELRGRDHGKWLKKSKRVHPKGGVDIGAISQRTSAPHQGAEQKLTGSPQAEGNRLSVDNRLARRRLMDYLEIYFGTQGVPEGDGAVSIPRLIKQRCDLLRE